MSRRRTSLSHQGGNFGNLIVSTRPRSTPSSFFTMSRGGKQAKCLVHMRINNACIMYVPHHSGVCGGYMKLIRVHEVGVMSKGSCWGQSGRCSRIAPIYTRVHAIVAGESVVGTILKI